MKKSLIFSAPPGHRDWSKEIAEAKALLVNTFESLTTDIKTPVGMVVSNHEMSGLKTIALLKGDVMNHQDQIGTAYISMDSNKQLEQSVVVVNVESIVKNYQEFFYESFKEDLDITLTRNDAVIHAALIQIGKIIKLNEMLRLNKWDVIQTYFNSRYEQKEEHESDLSSDPFNLAGELYAATKIFKYINKI